MVKPFQAPNTSDQPGGSTILDRLGDLIEESFDSLAQAVTNDVIVTATLGATDVIVTHGLGYPPKTWEVVDRDANATVWRTAVATTKTITLRASASVKVALRFT